MKLLSGLLMGFAVCGLVVGCGGGTPADQPDLGQVTGKVTLDGQPLAEALVTFQPAEGRAASAETDAEGNYKLAYNNDVFGAKVGQNSVRITKAVVAEDGSEKESIPPDYNIDTGLAADVKPGSNTFDFTLLTNP